MKSNYSLHTVWLTQAINHSINVDSVIAYHFVHLIACDYVGSDDHFKSSKMFFLLKKIFIVGLFTLLSYITTAVSINCCNLWYFYTCTYPELGRCIMRCGLNSTGDSISGEPVMFLWLNYTNEMLVSLVSLQLYLHCVEAISDNESMKTQLVVIRKLS